MIQRSAPAKINLYLHVVGKRADGYHLLDSLFAFAKSGDVVTVGESDGLSLTLGGLYGAKLAADADNSVLKAARLLAQYLGVPAKAQIRLEKNLPVASGIGGGSADAAAALLALNDLWGKRAPMPALREIALKIGADVPACLSDKAVFVSGIGENVEEAPAVPLTPVVLVNPNIALSTPAVFKNRKGDFDKPMRMEAADFAPENFIEALSLRANGLQNAAIALVPEIKAVLDALENRPACRLARMSGSGATCFGVFKNAGEADACASVLREKHPEWWIFPTFLT